MRCEGGRIVASSGPVYGFTESTEPVLESPAPPPAAPPPPVDTVEPAPVKARRKKRVAAPLPRVARAALQSHQPQQSQPFHTPTTRPASSRPKRSASLASASRALRSLDIDTVLSTSPNANARPATPPLPSEAGGSPSSSGADSSPPMPPSTAPPAYARVRALPPAVVSDADESSRVSQLSRVMERLRLANSIGQQYAVAPAGGAADVRRVAPVLEAEDEDDGDA